MTILCRFADYAGEPKPKSYFDALMLGSASPGMDHYWREVSYNAVNLAGSGVYGWYTLPQPRSYYVLAGGLDFNRALNDCTGVADAAVHFPSYVGINLVFNHDLDGFAWGGSSTLARDGQTRFYSLTWLPPWGYTNQAVIAHEMGTDSASLTRPAPPARPTTRQG